MLLVFTYMLVGAPGECTQARQNILLQIHIHPNNETHSGCVSLDQPDTAAATPGPILAALHGTITINPTTNNPAQARLLDFAMCNPPFFASLDEIGSAHGPHGKGAGVAPHACADEMLTPGGELSFVTAMVCDSLRLQKAVGWYSSMVGKKGTLRRVLALLRGAGVRNMRTTEFLQVSGCVCV